MHTQPAVLVRDLCFQYDQSPTLNQLSFTIERGSIFGFLGPSGAGKSTTQNILTGLLRGYSGQVEVLGRTPHAWGRALYERIGVAFELPTHFRKLSALENLRYFAALYQRQAITPEQALEQVGLADSGHLRVEQFSKGMQNRLSIARALLHGPELLFLDEPTSGLDPVSSRLICELIARQRAAGTTIFLTTHAMAVADALCDQVAFIVEGRIPLIDSPRALKLRYGTPEVAIEYRNGVGVAQRRFALSGLAENVDFLHILRDTEIQTIHSREASLEDIFVQITGRSLA